MSSSNYLSIPQGTFGISGINTGNLVYKAVKAKSSTAVIEYEASKKLITIKNLAEVTIKELAEVLYNKKQAPKYGGWYPTVEEKKDSDGNFLIKFSCFPPSGVPAAPNPHGDGQTTLPRVSRYSDFLKPSFIMPPTSWLTSISKETVSVVEKELSKAVISALTSIMTNTRREFSGVWYPANLKDFLSKTSKEMPAEYWTGHASQDYFNKKGRFTFELKEGKSASEAINTLIVGPSVLDCGNATQLAYYKAMLDVVGTEKFDALFSGGIFRLKITQKGIIDSDSPISHFSDYTSASKKRLAGSIGNRPLNIGEECHLKGVKFYANKHPVGFAGGWNVINVGNNESGEQLFVAHGLKSPMTEKEINKLLLESYNQERTPEDELYIRENPSPQLYDRRLNSFLKTYYTVPINLKDKMVEGFLKGSCRGIKSELVARVLEENIDKKFHSAFLLMKRIGF
ncbi:hypothetical protein COB11_01945 [Candidatus Aerophobetes bacterium]|uniref:Uncharacterized protein n=1 Tax=Aerophobetes bacterium TaxID=2030807 RepID=A0A2A4YKX4_UNCAE|nr:MAG: hypothetical protein COB11_01945 [Candidatus Aerophobetes bacterium]